MGHRAQSGEAFNGHDLRRLRRARDQATDARDFRRFQAVLLVASGRPVTEVAEIVGASRQSVHSWVVRYLRERTGEALKDRPRSGRPAAAPAVSDELIERELRRNPWELGYSSNGWTVALLALHLRQLTGHTMSERTLRRRMRALGFRWKRPRYVYVEKDPARAQKKGAFSAG